jgi:hypothetical protein
MSRQLHTIEVFDTTVLRHTAEILLDQILQILSTIKNKWRVVPIAFCSDASGESRKARRKLLELQPNLVVLDCWAHQVCLINLCICYPTFNDRST